MKTTSLLNLIAGLASITAIGSVQLVLTTSSPFRRPVAPRAARVPVALDAAAVRVLPAQPVSALSALELQVPSN